MASGEPIPFYQIVCRGPGCGAPFYVCRPCYRGQCYCSEGCRRMARRGQGRRSNARHQRTEWGRLDHRDRQRAYRERKAVVVCVTDQRSGEPGDVPTLGADAREVPRAALICIVCGRAGTFVDPWRW
jgi:hypothetical protein